MQTGQYGDNSKLSGAIWVQKKCNRCPGLSLFVLPLNMVRDVGQLKMADAVQQRRLKVAMAADISDSSKSIVNQNVLWDRAYYAMMQGDIETAHKFRDEYLNLGLENPKETVPFQKMQAMLAIHEKRPDEAISYFEQSQGYSAKYRLALAYKAKGENDKANQLLTEITNSYNRSILYLVVRNSILKDLKQYTRKD